MRSMRWPLQDKAKGFISTFKNNELKGFQVFHTTSTFLFTCFLPTDSHCISPKTSLEQPILYKVCDKQNMNREDFSQYISNISTIICRISLSNPHTFTYQSCLSLDFSGRMFQQLWWKGSHLRKWQHQFSPHPLPGTLLYTVLLKGNDACTGSSASMGMFVLICHDDWDDRTVWNLSSPGNNETSEGKR